MLKPLAAFAALTATTTLLALAAPAAHAAGLSPNLSIHTTGLNGATTLVGRNWNPYGSYTPPPYNYGGPRGPRGTTSFSSNDQFDTTGNLNPGGGGGGSGTTPVKKPNLQ